MAALSFMQERSVLTRLVKPLPDLLCGLHEKGIGPLKIGLLSASSINRGVHSSLGACLHNERREQDFSVRMDQRAPRAEPPDGEPNP
jgi:hypothetical protein